MEKELAPDSGGAGRYRGGLGQECVVENRSGNSMQLSLLSDRHFNPASGMHGGQAGGTSKIELSSKRVPHPKSRTTLAAGEKLMLRYAGGGGFGDPKQRPIAEVEQDVRAGYVSLDQASQIYGKSLAISEQDENG